MTKKQEAVKLRKAKELAGNDGHEWDALDGAVQHSYFHTADVVLRSKPKTPQSEKHGHVHEAAQKVIDEAPGAKGEPKTMTTEELLEMGIRVAPPETDIKKIASELLTLQHRTEQRLEVTGGKSDSSGAGPDNKPPRSKDISKPKRTRKPKAGKKTRK